MKLFNKSLGLLFLVLLGAFVCPTFAADDSDEGDEDNVINDEGTVNSEDAADAVPTEEEGADVIKASPHVKANILFVQPEKAEFPAGRLVKLLVGFHNNAPTPFIVEGLEGSFRYPQDFQYHIQNFSAFQYNKQVDASKEATFEYLFTPSETFSSRQFGLVINLRYKNGEGKQFLNTVYNETISVVEPEEELDGETFFLYIFLAAIVVLLLVGAQHFFSIFTKKRRSTKSSNGKSAVSNGNGATSSSSGDVDLSWIPKAHLPSDKSPRQSPRQRKSARVAGGNSSNDEQ